VRLALRVMRAMSGSSDAVQDLSISISRSCMIWVCVGVVARRVQSLQSGKTCLTSPLPTTRPYQSAYRRPENDVLRGRLRPEHHLDVYGGTTWTVVPRKELRCARRGRIAHDP
jgi:hypothetical protein